MCSVSPVEERLEIAAPDRERASAVRTPEIDVELGHLDVLGLQDNDTEAKTAESRVRLQRVAHRTEAAFMESGVRHVSLLISTVAFLAAPCCLITGQPEIVNFYEGAGTMQTTRCSKSHSSAPLWERDLGARPGLCTQMALTTNSAPSRSTIPRLPWRTPVRGCQMDRFRIGHRTALLLALVLGATVLLPGTALARGQAPKRAACTSATGDGSPTPSPISLNGCSPTPNATAPGAIPTVDFPVGTGSATVTWADGATTTFTYTGVAISHFVTSRHGSIVVNSKWRCPGDPGQIDLTGAITGNANLPAKDGGLKGKVKATFCADVQSDAPLMADLELAPGSAFKL